MPDDSRLDLSDGGRISGSATPTLTIAGAVPEDVGGYDCVVWNSCGSETSAVATVRCGADIDGNLFVNGDDFDTFVAAFVAGDPLSDFDHDGFVTGVDFDSFTWAFEQGC